MARKNLIFPKVYKCKSIESCCVLYRDHAEEYFTKGNHGLVVVRAWGKNEAQGEFDPYAYEEMLLGNGYHKVHEGVGLGSPDIARVRMDLEGFFEGVKLEAKDHNGEWKHDTFTNPKIAYDIAREMMNLSIKLESLAQELQQYQAKRGAQ